jgi:hypothetical protein
MQQTSNDWFAEQLIELNKTKIVVTNSDIIKLSKKANEMHKQQVCKAFSEGDIPFSQFKNSEEYYTKTFKIENNETNIS